MKRVTTLMRDQMDRPLDRAVYWIEYVIRHCGAPHLRTASRKLWLYQRGLLDVTIVVFVFCFVLGYVFFCFCRFSGIMFFYVTTKQMRMAYVAGNENQQKKNL
jgi:glucuronosyltransferase